MADQALEDSERIVAFRLMQIVASVEGKDLNREGGGADRKYVLDTYVECLHAAAGTRIVVFDGP
jgi:hypothetical protein